MLRPYTIVTKIVGATESGEGSAEAADYSILAQGDHGVEERGGDGLADDGDAGGVDEEAGFDAAGLGDGAGGVVAGVVVPLG
jgi:hypothetical protein